MHTDRRALLALFCGAVLIGFAPIFVRLADVGYTAIAFWWTALSLPVLLPLWWRFGGVRPRLFRRCAAPSSGSNWRYFSLPPLSAPGISRFASPRSRTRP